MKKVGIVMGSKSDAPIAEKAIDVLKEYGIETDVHVFSAHRCPDNAISYAKNARANGISCLIAFAGMAAHLAGTLRANTTLPVIGVPCKSASFDGMDALLSTVMMPSGIPVATVAVDGGKNAALLAVQIIAVTDETLQEKLQQAREIEKENVLLADRELNKKYR